MIFFYVSGPILSSSSSAAHIWCFFFVLKIIRVGRNEVWQYWSFMAQGA